MHPLSRLSNSRIWFDASLQLNDAPLSILEPQLLLKCLAAGSQSLKGFGKVCQQLHYLCESAVQSDNIPCEASYGVSICLVMRLKRSSDLSRVCHSPQPSDVMKRTVLMLHARNTLLERCLFPERPRRS